MKANMQDLETNSNPSWNGFYVLLLRLIQTNIIPKQVPTLPKTIVYVLLLGWTQTHRNPKQIQTLLKTDF